MPRPIFCSAGSLGKGSTSTPPPPPHPKCFTKGNCNKYQNWNSLCRSRKKSRPKNSQNRETESKRLPPKVSHESISSAMNGDESKKYLSEDRDISLECYGKLHAWWKMLHLFWCNKYSCMCFCNSITNVYCKKRVARAAITTWEMSMKKQKYKLLIEVLLTLI